MENRLKCSRREFAAAAGAFGAVSSLLGAVPPPAAAEERLTVLLSGVRMDGLAAALSDRGGALSRRVETILAMRPLPCRCLVLPESPAISAADGELALKKVFSASGIEVFMAEWEMVRTVRTADCDFMLLGDTEGVLAPSVQDWLAAELPRWPRPVFICATHPPEWMQDGLMRSLAVNGRRLAGLLGDTPRLAGYLHGCGHRWQPTCERTGNGRAVRMLSLPSAEAWGDIGHVLMSTVPGCATAVLRQDGFNARPASPACGIHADLRSMVAANRGATCSFRWNTI